MNIFGNLIKKFCLQDNSKWFFLLLFDIHCHLFQLVINLAGFVIQDMQFLFEDDIIASTKDFQVKMHHKKASLIKKTLK